MLLFLDIFIFMVVAVIFAVRLWSILGQEPKMSKRTAKPKEHDPLVKKVRGKIVYLHRERYKKNPENLSFEDVYGPFDESLFLKGAEKAFWMIVQGYQEKAWEDLKPLVSIKTLAKLQKTGSDLIPEPSKKLLSALVESKAVDGDVARVEVLFTLQGSSPMDHLEYCWTFERKIESLNPNWVLVL